MDEESDLKPVLLRLPDNLYRQTKIAAIEDGVRFRDWWAEAARARLRERDQPVAAE